MRTTDDTPYAAEDTSDYELWYSPLEGGLNHEEMHKAEFAASAARLQRPLDELAVSLGPIDNTDPDLVVTSNLSGAEGADVFSITLEAGETYSFSYRGTVEGGIEDPYLALFGPDFNIITEDDDGGLGRTSQITFTATTTGTYYIYATSWYTLAYGDPSLDTGDYTIAIWQQDPAADVGDTFETASELTAGTEYGYLDSSTDVDVFKIDFTAGNLYSLTFAGGAAGGAEFGEPGSSIAYLDLYDAEGNLLASNLNYESSVSFFAEESGTYYVALSPYAGLAGGYTLDVAELDPADYDPLDSINWVNADNVPFVDVDGVPTAYVYFAPAGENFGELGDDGLPMVTYGWEQFQIDGVMTALGEYEKILGVNYEITTDASQATFRLLTTESAQYGAYMYPQDPGYGDAQGISAYNLLSGGFTLEDSLEQGGFAFAVILHEMGHGHGLAHPHDNGGGSDIMLGVNGSSSLGVYDLNQGAYTVMSYNDGWQTNPDGAQPLTLATVGYGWSGSLSAFDIAQLQARYGVHAYNEGDDVYMLPDTNEIGTYFQTIWDSGGTDEIAYAGERDVRIDLLAATLDYSPTGGGVVSWAEGVKGGYTIANGVVIENATGGSGNDVLLGNEVDNKLLGNDGDDTLMGREGDDLLQGGDGDDVLEGGDGDDHLSGGGGNDVINGGAGNDFLVGGGGSNLFVFDTFDGSVDEVKGYNAKKDSIEIDSDGDVAWLDVNGGAELYVDGQLVAIFSGAKVGDMVDEWAGSEIIDSLAGFGGSSAASVDLFEMSAENMV